MNITDAGVVLTVSSEAVIVRLLTHLLHSQPQLVTSYLSSQTFYCTSRFIMLNIQLVVGVTRGGN